MRVFVGGNVVRKNLSGGDQNKYEIFPLRFDGEIVQKFNNHAFQQRV